MNSPVNLATPLNVISSIITGSERPFAFTAKSIKRYELLDSTLSRVKDTGGLCIRLNYKLRMEEKMKINFSDLINGFS